MRTIRLILKDRGVATPLIVLLVQLIVLHASGGAIASGAMAAQGGGSTVWCVSGANAPSQERATIHCACAFLCASQAAAGHVVAPDTDAVLVFVTVEAAARARPVVVDRVPPRQPPPRPNLTRGPPAV